MPLLPSLSFSKLAQCPRMLLAEDTKDHDFSILASTLGSCSPYRTPVLPPMIVPPYLILPARDRHSPPPPPFTIVRRTYADDRLRAPAIFQTWQLSSSRRPPLSLVLPLFHHILIRSFFKPFPPMLSKCSPRELLISKRGGVPRFVPPP